MTRKLHSAPRRAAVFTLFGICVLIAAIAAIGGPATGNTLSGPALSKPMPAGHVHIHKYTPKNNPDGGSGWKHEGGDDWHFLVDGTTDYEVQNNDSTKVDPDDYTITETLTTDQLAAGWQLIDIYIPGHGKGTSGGGNDQCEKNGPRSEAERRTSARVLDEYFTDQDHNNSGTVHICAFNKQTATRRISLQKVTGTGTHPGGAFTVSVGAQARVLTLVANGGSSAVQTMDDAPANQSLALSESFPSDPAGWSLDGFIVKADSLSKCSSGPDTRCPQPPTCSAADSDWNASASVPADDNNYLVCVKDTYTSAPPSPPVTIRAYKAICDSFSYVPRNEDGGVTDHFGELVTGAPSATRPVAAGAPLPAGCHLSTEPFSFRYNYDQTMITDPDPQPSGGTAFGPTGSESFAEVTLERSHFLDGHRVWISEVPGAGYAFAGLRCHRDVVNQDNSEWIIFEAADSTTTTAYCMAYNVATGSIGGTKYGDANANGSRDAGEPGLGGWTITATRQGSPSITPSIVQTLTGGTFNFENLPEGTYQVCETAQPGWTAIQPPSGCQAVVVAAGAQVSGIDFGNAQFGSLTVAKIDVGLNGTWHFSANGPTSTEPKDINANGTATFSGLLPGVYIVTETNGSATVCVPGDSVTGDRETRHGSSGNAGQSVPGTVATGIQVVGGETATVYFFNRDCGSVLTAPALVIRKFSDPRGDRTGTVGLGGTRFIVKRDGTEISGSPFTTPPDGTIVLSGLDTGRYTVAETVPPGYRLTGSKTDMGDDGSFEANVGGQPAPVDLHLDDAARIVFYDQPVAAVRVKKDVVTGGSPKPGKGWTFTLSGCGIVHLQGTTDNDGLYTFANLPPAIGCTYWVKEEPREGWIVTPDATQPAAPSAAGEVAEVRFMNVKLTPCDDCAPTVPTPAPTCTPTPTDTPTVTETPKTPETPATTETPTPVQRVAGEVTPLPPKTGCGDALSNQDGSNGGGMSVLIAAMGLAFAAMAGVGTGFHLLQHRRANS